MSPFDEKLLAENYGAAIDEAAARRPFVGSRYLKKITVSTTTGPHSGRPIHHPHHGKRTCLRTHWRALGAYVRPLAGLSRGTSA